MAQKKQQKQRQKSVKPTGIKLCPHCGRIIVDPHAPKTMPKICPNCKMSLDEVHLA